MFRGWVFAILTLLCLLGGVITYHLADVEEGDLGTYQRLLERSKGGAVQAAPKTAQDRTRVVKDLWLSDGCDRLHTRLTSDASQLVLTTDSEIPQAIEVMEGVTGYMQEALYYTTEDGRRATQVQPGLFRIEGNTSLCTLQEGWTAMQEIRYLRAERATYDYRTRKLAAEEVSIVRFDHPGHDLVESLEEVTPSITGTARTVELTLGSKEPDFRAHHVKAKIFAHDLIL